METVSAIAGLRVNKPRGFIVMVEAEKYQPAQSVPPPHTIPSQRGAYMFELHKEHVKAQLALCLENLGERIQYVPEDGTIFTHFREFAS